MLTNLTDRFVLIIFISVGYLTYAVAAYLFYTNRRIPRYRSFDCSGHVNWHNRCCDYDCECKCHG